jgi:hypothetical protein
MRGLAFIIVSLMILLPMGGRAEGAGVSKFAITTFTLGVAMKFGSAYMDKMANQSYDEYLHTAVQAEMESHLNEYRGRHWAAIALSGASVGFIALSAVYSLYNALRPPEESPVSLRLENNGREMRMYLYASLPIRWIRR